MDGRADNGKQSGSKPNDDFAAPWEPAGLGCPASEAIEGKPLTNAFDADLGCALDYPPHAPDFALRARSARIARTGGIMAIVLLELVSLSVRPAGREQVSRKANLAITRRNEVERHRIATSPIEAPTSVRRASRKTASSTAPAPNPQRHDATTVVRIAPGQRRYLGIDEEPTFSSGARPGMRITRVYPGTAAEAAGLRIGDVLRSANGYLTEKRGNLAWIIAYATPDSGLQLVITSARDGWDHAITARFPKTSQVAAIQHRQSPSSCECGSDAKYAWRSTSIYRTVVYWPQANKRDGTDIATD